VGIRRLELFSRKPRVPRADGLLSVGKGLETIGRDLPSIWQKSSQKGLRMNLYRTLSWVAILTRGRIRREHNERRFRADVFAAQRYLA
jgi:hypothetical protein